MARGAGMVESKNIVNKEKILEQARLFIEEGRFDKAIREYEKILLVDPNDLRINLRIAELYVKRKQIQDAIRIYREVADAYAAEGFYLKAVTVYKNVLRLNPSLIEINEQLGVLYEQMGLPQDAVRQYDILASALDQKGEVDRVLDLRARIVRLRPADGTAKIRLAELYQREGRIDDAIDQYEDFARLLEGSGERPERLADVYEKILAHRPENEEMIRKVITIYERVGEHKKALKWLEAGSAFVEKDAQLLDLMAHLYAAQNQSETARGKYMQLADLQAAAGNVDAALQAYYDILVLLPDEEDRLEARVNELKPGAIAELSARAQKTREEEEAAENRRQAAEEAGEELPEEAPASPPAPAPQAKREEEPPAPAPEPPPPPPKAAPDRRAAEAAFDLGQVYLGTGLSDEARAEFEKAESIYNACLEADPDDSTVRERLTRIASLLGRAAPSAPAVEAVQPEATPDESPAEAADAERTDEPKEPSPEKEKEKKREEKPKGTKKISYV